MMKHLSLFLISLLIAFTVNAQQLLFEDFDDFPSVYSSDPIASTGWTEAKGVEGSLTIENSKWGGSGYTDRVAAFTFSEYNSTDNDEWLITPALDLTQNGGKNTLSFIAKCSFTQSLGNDFIKIMVSTDGGTSFSLLKEFKTYTKEFTKEIIDLSAYSTYNNVKFAFYAHDSGSDDYDIEFNLDKVTIDATPDVELGIIDNKENTFTSSDTTVFISQKASFRTVVKNYGKTTAAGNIKMLVNNGEVGSKALNILAGETAIIYFDEWTAPTTEGEYSIDFVIENNLDIIAENNTRNIKVKVYEPLTTLDENFDASTAFPANWYSFIHSSGDNPVIEVKSYYKAHSEPNCLYMNDGTTYVSELYTSTPALKLQAGDKYRTSFWFNGSSTSSSLIIYQTTNPYDKVSYQELKTFNLEVSYTNQLCEFEFVPSEITYLIFAYNSPGKYVYVDDVKIEKVQDYELSLAQLSAETSIASGLSAIYQYEVYNKGAIDSKIKFTAPTSDHIAFTIMDENAVNEIESIDILSGEKAIFSVKLESGEISEAQVSANFNIEAYVDGHTEVKANIASLLNIYNPLTALNEEFETNKTIPELWTLYEDKATNLIRFFNSTYYSHSGEGYVQLSNTSTEGAIARLITPVFKGGNCYYVNFYASSGGSIIIGTQTNPTDANTYEALDTIKVTSSYEHYKLPVNMIDQQKAIVFSNLIDGTYDKVTLDDVTIEEMPKVNPEINVLTKQNAVYSEASDRIFIAVSNKGYQSGTFNISVNGNWVYSLLDKTGTTEITDITLAENQTDTLMLQFTASQASDVEISETCSFDLTYTVDGIESTYNYTHNLVAYKHYKELVNDFESTDFPKHFGFNVEGSEGVSVSDVNTYSQDYCIKVRKSFSATKATIFSLPAFEDYSGGYNISFYALGGNNAVAELGTISSMEGFDNFTKLGEVTPTGEYAHYQIRVKPEANTYLAIRNNVAGSNIYIDSLVIKPYPVAVGFTPANESENVKVNIHPTISFTKAVRLLDNTELTAENLKPFISFNQQTVEGEAVDFSLIISDDFKSIELIPSQDLDDNEQYFIALNEGLEDFEDNPVGSESVSFTTEDNTAPEFFDTYPMLSDVTTSYADIKVKVTESAKVYYIAIANDATAPSAQQIIDGNAYNNVNIISKGTLPIEASKETILSVLGLEAENNYDVYLALIDNSSNQNINQNIVKIDVQTPDITAPEFIENYPSVDNITVNEAQVNIKVNEDGDIYYAIMDINSEDLSVEELINNISTLDAVNAATFEINANTEVNLTIDQLSQDTQYNLFIVAVDKAGNKQSEVSKLTFTTEKETTGINDLNTLSVNVWPNPVTEGIINVSSENEIEVQIFNALGMKVLETSKTNFTVQLNVSNLDSGVYFIVINDSNNKHTQKVIIK